jgi:phosphate transport system substrate-binding protein
MERLQTVNATLMGARHDPDATTARPDRGGWQRSITTIRAGGAGCHPGGQTPVAFPTTTRIGGLALAAAVIVGACSSSASPAPAASTGAGASAPATTAASAPASAPASAAAGTTAPEPGTATVKLQGAGATFPAPLYQVWFEAYSAKYANVSFDYQANGSGAGIKAITEGTVDFGASDAAMKDEEIAKLPAGTTVLHIPTALGAVVPIYNISGVTALNLDADTISGIFLGTITKWNDAKIAALNAGTTLPDTAITVVHRSDGSGTTNAWTTYLDTVSPDWHSKVGKGKEVNWPTGIGSQGNDGVAGSVKQTDGAIGYVELNYASQANIPSALVKNAAGKFVAGSTDGVTAAAAAVTDFPADFRQQPIINGAGDTTYPIAAYTYLLVPVEWKDADKAKAMVAFANWALTDGQAQEAALGYAPLPSDVAQKAIVELHKVTSGGSPVWP